MLGSLSRAAPAGHAGGGVQNKLWLADAEPEGASLTAVGFVECGDAEGKILLPPSSFPFRCLSFSFCLFSASFSLFLSPLLFLFFFSPFSLLLFFAGRT